MNESFSNHAAHDDHDDVRHLRRAVQLALEAERLGNLPVGAVITLGAKTLAEAGNAVLIPNYHPGRHAEIEALRLVPVELWPLSREMTCYTTLEPCVMCAGALLLHGIGRVVFGTTDSEGGAGRVLSLLPDYYAGGAGVPLWVGPLLPEICDALYDRVKAGFDRLPCGKSNF
ncbi:MAG TPA: nucleoside deaminase [Pyrinomonadaceae bacterium]|jgi:tRNA(adenine34) deaminase|nr:nucleoside deaminase [Pyrinomonadaceae bacterium]